MTRNPSCGASTLAEAVVTLPSLASTTSGPPRRMVFDLLASMVIAAIGRELSGRLPYSPGTLLHDSASLGPAPHYPGGAGATRISAGRR